MYNKEVESKLGILLEEYMSKDKIKNYHILRNTNRLGLDVILFIDDIIAFKIDNVYELSGVFSLKYSILDRISEIKDIYDLISKSITTTEFVINHKSLNIRVSGYQEDSTIVSLKISKITNEILALKTSCEIRRSPKLSIEPISDDSYINFDQDHRKNRTMVYSYLIVGGNHKLNSIENLNDRIDKCKKGLKKMLSEHLKSLNYYIEE